MFLKKYIQEIITIPHEKLTWVCAAKKEAILINSLKSLQELNFFQTHPSVPKELGISSVCGENLDSR